ncbi:hypothetical protein L1049_003606 [Liquidambar formosana]|uniref:Glycosyltransferase n=1 Tax=Liquidambar formosana TaxID=63359 RepID=A0AAP0R013_LIQFO
MSGEMFEVSGSGRGHLYPCLELCKHLASRNYKATLVISSNLSSTVPDLTHYPLIEIALIAGSSGPPLPGSDQLRQQSALDLEAHLSKRSNSPDMPHSLCAIIDFQLGWTKEVFGKFNIPMIGFFTFGACAAAMEWGAWKAEVGSMNPGEVRGLPGLPESMNLTYSDLKRRPTGPPHGGPPGRSPPGVGSNQPPKGGGPPKPGDRPPWVPAIEGSVALMFNTCDDLERPFIDYMAKQMGMPVWGVGPLLPERYWKSFNSLIRDGETRAQKRPSNYTEDEVIQWLDSKPRRSVLYVSFGSEAGLSMEECPRLAGALRDSTRPFIWVIQPGSSGVDYFPHEGERGLIIRGWAPQLLILSHPSTGGFLSHCGWNSTAEAIGRGVPFLAWPLRGDQHYNAKLVVKHLKVGYMATSGDASQMVQKEDILKGIEKLMGDEETSNRAAALRAKFECGFPVSSETSLDAFGDFIHQKAD